MTIRKDVKYQALVHFEYFEKSLRTIAGKYGISKSILSKWLKHKSKPCVPTSQNARPNSLVNRIQDQVERVVQYDPYVSASEIRSKLSVNVARSVSLSTVYRALHAKRITYKRAQRCPKGSPPSSHPFMQVPDPYENAISIDECHFYTSDRRRRGWAKKGRRVPKEPLRGRTSTRESAMKFGHEIWASSKFHVLTPCVKMWDNKASNRAVCSRSYIATHVHETVKSTTVRSNAVLLAFIGAPWP
jgi:transposase